MDSTTVVWTIGFPLLLALVGAGAGIGFAMTNSESGGFLVAKACFAVAAFDVVGFAVFWAVTTHQVTPWNIITPTIAAVIAVPALVLSLQWLGNLEIQLSTRLFPSNLPTPPIPKAPQIAARQAPEAPQEALKVFFGTNVAWATNFPHTVLRMAGEEMIVFDKNPARKELVLTVLKIFDDRNDIIARLDNDGFWVKNSTRSKRPDPSTLVVYDHSDTEVLRIVFLNPNAISLTGIFRHAGIAEPIIVTKEYMILPRGGRMSGSVFGATAPNRADIGIN